MSTFIELTLFVLLSLWPWMARGSEQQRAEIPNQQASRRLKINLICYRNGVGLNQDVDLLLEELTRLGHCVRFVNSQECVPTPKVDINIFVDVVEEFFFAFGDKNYLIPNPEWCFLSPQKIAQFDMILCKTKEAERIFKPLNPHTVWMGFTCKDRFSAGVAKNYKSPLHLAGASIQKGTEGVVQTWMQNPQFPLLLLIKHKGHSHYPPTSNLHFICEYLPEPHLTMLQNSCGLHLCPSETEGFGHYLIEALSCGSVVVTTDAPPMNEFVLDKRCLVKYTHSAPWRLATSYYVDLPQLEDVVASLLSLSEEELKEIGKKNREFYLENDRLFKQRLADIFRASF